MVGQPASDFEENRWIESILQKGCPLSGARWNGHAAHHSHRI